MEQNEALGYLIQGVRIAQKRGAYNLQEAATISDAVSVFVPAEEATTETGNEVTDETSDETTTIVDATEDTTADTTEETTV